MQYSTAFSDGVLVLACLASAWVLRRAFQGQALQRALLLGFGLPALAAFCGVMRYAIDPGWGPQHSAFSQMSSYLGLPLLGLAATSLSLGKTWSRATGTLAVLGLVGFLLAAQWLQVEPTYRLLLNLLTLLLIAFAGLRHWQRLGPPAAALAVVGLFAVAGLVVGTQGFIGPLRRVDLFHALLTLAYPLLAWLLLSLRTDARAEIRVKTL
ncbi:hypothetical protein [Aquipseudomonas ullengensis]|uniref:Uncharacterized protein n=1 Tax=Aquipseudomonas ullengensis TaxID=2759166 RepID=A0A7W4LI69_9GAMM|nr:hypothetical protein [Pseudomonas ullengensis]MBB2493644.1 hypothetical protein [Pseudomonas ullengensis]